MIDEDPGSMVTRPDLVHVDRVATWQGLSTPAAGGGDEARTIPGGHVAQCRRPGQGVETGALAAAGDVCLPCRHLVVPLVQFCTWRHGRVELAGGLSPLALRGDLSPVPAAGGDKVHVGQAGRRHHRTSPSVVTAGGHPGAPAVATRWLVTLVLRLLRLPAIRLARAARPGVMTGGRGWTSPGGGWRQVN